MNTTPTPSLYVDETGTLGAPSIVFLHGIGASGWMWWQQIAALSDFHCLNVDLPGHGKSNHVTWVSVADAADQVAALLQSRALNGRSHVVGLSLGGHVALSLLERHAALLDRVVISGVTAAPIPNRSLLPVQLALMTPLMKTRWFANMQAKARPLPPEMQAALVENLQAMSSQAYRRIYQEVVNFQPPAALREVTNPTLITAGSRESKIIIQAVEALAKMMPHAQGRLAPAVGHGWNVEAPALFNAMVRAWITGAPLPVELQPLPA